MQTQIESSGTIIVVVVAVDKKNIHCKDGTISAQALHAGICILSCYIFSNKYDSFTVYKEHIFHKSSEMAHDSINVRFSITSVSLF